MTKEMILVTGGLGYIGSHCVVVLLEAGYDVVIVDNLDNSKESVLDGIEKITGSRPLFCKCDIRAEEQLSLVFSQYSIDAVIHFAAKKAVGESMEVPFEYYDNNVTGTQILLKVMDRFSVRKIVFSSTCTVYSSINTPPFIETMSTGPTAVYGITKVMCEEMIRGLTLCTDLTGIILRYFNPIGNHSSGLIGENPKQKALNIMPVIMEVLEKKREKLQIFGNDYPTSDGTCQRDYLHVMDVALAHLSALRYFDKKEPYSLFNIGTGHPLSVLDAIALVEDTLSLSVPFEVVAKRHGDPATLFGDCEKAKRLLGWEAKFSLKEAIQDMRTFRNHKAKL